MILKLPHLGSMKGHTLTFKETKMQLEPAVYQQDTVSSTKIRNSKKQILEQKSHGVSSTTILMVYELA